VFYLGNSRLYLGDQKAKGLMFSLMWNIDLIQITVNIMRNRSCEQRSHMREGMKEEVMKVNMVDTLSVQE
jgi:hypothetical protein